MINIEPLLKTETPRVEWKRSVDRKDVLQAACAFANDIGASGAPGFLLLGVDKDGSVRGLPYEGTKLDEEMQRIGSWLRSINLLPTPSAHLEAVRFEDKLVLVVEVAPSAVPPVVEVDGTAWVRPATSTVRATPADITRLRERRPLSARPFDARPVDGAGLDDLNTSLLRQEYLAQKDTDEAPDLFPDFESWLSTRRQLGEPVRGAFVPNAAALLLYGRSPQAWLPGAFIDIVRYAGCEVDADVAWRRPAMGTVADQLDLALQTIAGEVPLLAPPSDSAVEPYIPAYPKEALEELVRNLVQHKLYEGTHAPARIEWFDDRVELSNPGAPFGRASEGEFGAHSDYRNPTLTAGLVALGYVRQLGRGVRRARALLEKNGSPPLEVEVNGFTRVVVRRRTR